MQEIRFWIHKLFLHTYKYHLETPEADTPRRKILPKNMATMRDAVVHAVTNKSYLELPMEQKGECTHPMMQLKLTGGYPMRNSSNYRIAW